MTVYELYGVFGEFIDIHRSSNKFIMKNYGVRTMKCTSTRKISISGENEPSQRLQQNEKVCTGSSVGRQKKKTN